MAQIDFVCRCRFGCNDPIDEPQYDYVRIADPDEDISLLVGANDSVVSQKEISIKYDYPLKEPMSFTHKNEKGFTRADLVRCVADDYQRIYRDHSEKVDGSDYTSDLNYLVVSGLEKEGSDYQARVFS